MRRKTTEAARELGEGRLKIEPGKQAIMDTHRAVTAGWFGLADSLDLEGHRKLAATVRGFARAIPPPRTEKEAIADRLRGMSRVRSINTPTL